MTKLDVGCADIPLDGYIGVDAQSRSGVDVVCDLTTDSLPFSNGEVDEIYCSHMLEHVQKTDIIRVLAEFNRVLKSNGKLQIIVPDVTRNIQNLVEFEGDMERYNHVIESIYGGSVANPDENTLRYDNHKYAFTVKSLEWWCGRAGFETIKCESKEQGMGGYSIFYEGKKK